MSEHIKMCCQHPLWTLDGTPAGWELSLLHTLVVIYNYRWRDRLGPGLMRYRRRATVWIYRLYVKAYSGNVLKLLMAETST